MRIKEPEIEVFVSSEGDQNPYNPGDSESLWGSGLYCETVIKNDNKLLVPNAKKDPEWKNNPDIKLDMISYLGFPIHSPEGNPFGTICILDREDNSYSETVEKLITKFRDIIERDIEMIYVNQKLGDENKRLKDYLGELQTLRGIVTICSHCKSIKDKDNNWNPIEDYLINHPEADFSHGICPDCIDEHYPDFEKKLK